MIVALFALLTIAAVGGTLYATDDHFANDPASRASRGEVKGVAGASLLQPRNLARALAEIRRRAPGSTVKNARFAPGRIDLQMRDSDGRVTIYGVDASFSVSTNSFGDALDKGFPLAAINPAVPSKMFGDVKRRAHAGTGDLDYFVFDESSTETPYHWLLFFTADVPIADRTWEAEGKGRDLRKLGTPSRKQRAAQARNNRLQRCLSTATTGPEVQRCSGRFGAR